MPKNNIVMAKRLSTLNTSPASINQYHVTFAQFSYVFWENLAHWSTEELSEWHKLLKLFFFFQASSYESGFYYSALDWKFICIQEHENVFSMNFVSAAIWLLRGPVLVWFF